MRCDGYDGRRGSEANEGGSSIQRRIINLTRSTSPTKIDDDDDDDDDDDGTIPNTGARVDHVAPIQSNPIQSIEKCGYLVG